MRISHQGAMDRLNSAESIAATAFDAAAIGDRAAMARRFNKAKAEVALLFEALELEAVVVGNYQMRKHLMMLHEVLALNACATDFGVVLSMQKVHDSRLSLTKYAVLNSEIHPLPRRPLRKAPRRKA